MPGRIVPTVLADTAQQLGDAIALYQPAGGKSGGNYRTYSWNEWLRTSREIALGLSALGLKKGEIVCILSETRAEFYLVDIGIMGAGGVSAALYTAYPMLDLAGNLHSAEPRFLFVENVKTHDDLKAAAMAADVPWPEHVILMTGEASAGRDPSPPTERGTSADLGPSTRPVGGVVRDRGWSGESVALRSSSKAPGSLTLEQLRARGAEVLERDHTAYDQITEAISPADPAILYLTSGATGQPKMGLSSHAAVLANMDMGPAALPIGPQDSTLVFLPSAHIAQRIVLELVPMRMGTPVWFSESLARLPAELRSVRPTIFLAPPRVWERTYATILTEIKKRPAWARKLFHGALGLGLESVKYKRAGKELPAWLSRSLKMANRLVFTKIRERLGGRIRVAASGAAPLSKDLAEFFGAVGLPLIEGYGLTEAGIISFNPIDHPRAGSIGKLLAGVEGRLAEDGELQVRTPCLFLGYYRDEAATQSVMTPDGWFCTGDIGEVDSDGYWYITGRKKELIVSSNGKKIYPARIENLFKVEPLVNQVLLIGDKRPYVTALFTLNPQQTRDLQSNGSGAEGQTPRPEVVNKALQAAVSRVNKQLADFERIRRFQVLDRDFSIAEGELTPTMKIRRKQVLENHRELVNQLYLGREDSP